MKYAFLFIALLSAAFAGIARSYSKVNDPPSLLADSNTPGLHEAQELIREMISQGRLASDFRLVYVIEAGETKVYPLIYDSPTSDPVPHINGIDVPVSGDTGLKPGAIVKIFGRTGISSAQP
ncbi:hypothetical protein [Propionivibrio sp.]|uniref:hypothetical protein n=1 Tax=Propionivibrio sp. TaxID=2212460 RepID=UPI003BF223CB